MNERQRERWREKWRERQRKRQREAEEEGTNIQFLSSYWRNRSHRFFSLTQSGLGECSMTHCLCSQAQ